MFYFYKNHINRYIWSQLIRFFWRNIFIRLPIIKIKSLEISIFINTIFKIFTNYFKLYKCIEYIILKTRFTLQNFAIEANVSRKKKKKKGKFLAIFRFVSVLYNDCSIFIKVCSVDSQAPVLWTWILKKDMISSFVQNEFLNSFQTINNLKKKKKKERKSYITKKEKNCSMRSRVKKKKNQSMMACQWLVVRDDYS